MNKAKIKLAGTDFWLGLGFIMDLINNTDLDFDSIGKDPAKAFIEVPLLMYHAHVYHCTREDKEPILTLKDIYDLVDNNGGVGGKFWNDFQIAYHNSLFGNVPIQEDKKKAMKK